MHRLAPDVKTILHVGDFGYWKTGQRQGKGYLGAVDYWCKRAGIERILVTPGNHEQWSLLRAAFGKQPGQPIQITERAWAMPIGYRFRLGAHTYMSFGGAASFDADQRTEGVDWFPDEMATQAQANAAATGDPVDVLLTHETLLEPSPLVAREMERNRDSVSDEVQARSALSRQRVTQVTDHHQPARLFHGHFHTPDMMNLPGGRQVWSMGMDRQDRNVGVLDLDSLKFDWLLE
nr:metallophosphoesterase [Frondihabitans sucicola]